MTFYKENAFPDVQSSSCSFRSSLLPSSDMVKPVLLSLSICTSVCTSIHIFRPVLIKLGELVDGHIVVIFARI